MALAALAASDYLSGDNRIAAMPVTTLENRAFLAVTGSDAEDFLERIVTTDVVKLPAAEAWPGALLTPQGKILFDFLISRIDGGFVLETAAPVADAFVKRLTLYKLRANRTKSGISLSKFIKFFFCDTK